MCRPSSRPTSRPRQAKIRQLARTGGSSGSGGAPASDAGRSDAARDAAPPPVSGPGVDINGVRVPRDRAIVIVHFGHSNMLGQAYEPEALLPHFFETQPRLWSYRGNGSFVAAKEPTASTRRRDTAGPGMALLRAAAALAPSDYHFISVGMGVGSSTTQDWSKGGLYYDDYVALAAQLKGQVTFAAAVVMLGITDRHLPESQQADSQIAW